MGVDEDDLTTARADWTDEERALPGVGAELRRLARRARRRWPLTLAIVILVTGAALAAVARRPDVARSRVAFRVVDNEGGEPASEARLRDFIWQVAFTDAHLLPIIKENELYAATLAREPRQAAEEMREDIDVDVWRNADGPARVSIGYRGRDRDLVYAVTRRLGQLVVEQAANTRLRQAMTARRAADDAVDAARALVQRIKRAPQLDEPARRRAEAGLAEAEERREKAYRRVQLEQRASVLTWELVDRGQPAARGMDRADLFILVGVIAFLLALPAAAVAVGAFDPRVYDLDDIRRLGLRTVGAVRRFDGDNAGSLVERLRRQNQPPDEERDSMWLS